MWRDGTLHALPLRLNGENDDVEELWRFFPTLIKGQGSRCFLASWQSAKDPAFEAAERTTTQGPNSAAAATVSQHRRSRWESEARIRHCWYSASKYAKSFSLVQPYYVDLADVFFRGSYCSITKDEEIQLRLQACDVNLSVKAEEHPATLKCEKI